MIIIIPTKIVPQCFILISSLWLFWFGVPIVIFVINYNYSKDEALIIFPYEFLPIPKVGSLVDATDRTGQVVTKAKVVKVVKNKKYDHTLLVSITVPKKFVHKVRGIANLSINT